jgi:regulator of replication initiation timing
MYWRCSTDVVLSASTLGCANSHINQLFCGVRLAHAPDGWHARRQVGEQDLKLRAQTDKIFQQQAQLQQRARELEAAQGAMRRREQDWAHVEKELLALRRECDQLRDRLTVQQQQQAASSGESHVRHVPHGSMRPCVVSHSAAKSRHNVPPRAAKALHAFCMKSGMHAINANGQTHCVSAPHCEW